MPGKVFAASILSLTIGLSSVLGQRRVIDKDCLNPEGRFSVWTQCFHRQDSNGAPELLAVRVGKHHGFDRIVFDLKGVAVFDPKAQPTNYGVRYEKPPLEWYGDEVIKVKGKAFVEIALYPLSASAEKIVAYQRGALIMPKQKIPNMPLIKEIKPLGWFEAEVGYIIGLKRRTPFRVQLLSNPDRLVVDFKH